MIALLRRSRSFTVTRRVRLVVHHPRGDCALGAEHPAIDQVVLRAWAWYLGPVIDAIDLAAHRSRLARRWWCPGLCDRLVGDRGPWRAITRRRVSPACRRP